jgi:hypothetical protein
MKNRNIKILIAIFPIIFGVAMYWLRVNHYSIYEVIGKEDHIIEWMQFFFFFISGILAIIVAIKTGKVSKFMRIVFIILAIGLIFVAKEEISWGERLFNVSAPEVFDGDSTIPLLGENVQSEMNLHNFRGIHNLVGYAYILIATYAIFSSLLACIFYKIKKDVDIKTKFLVSFVTPPLYLMLYFIPLYINLLDRRALGIAPQDYEMVEFLLSLGTLIFLSICLKRINLYLKQRAK